MEVKKTYIITQALYDQPEVLFECANGKWYIQRNTFTMHGYKMIIKETSKEHAQIMLSLVITESTIEPYYIA